MKKVYTTLFKITLAVTIIIMSFDTKAQNGWELMYEENSPLGVIKGIVFVPGSDNLWQTGWAAQYDGTILKTTNGGDTWIGYSQSISNSIWGIDFIDENNGLACDNIGQIIKTTDGGQTWSLSYSNGSVGFSKIKYKDINHAVVVGYEQAKDITIDDPYTYMLSNDERADIAASPYNMYTNDGGATWEVASGGKDYWALDYAGDDTFYGVEAFMGDAGRTEDNGESWSPVYWTGWGLTVCVNFLDLDYGIIGGESLGIKITRDGADTWSTYTLGDGNGEILAAGWYDQDTVWASGVGVYKSTDGGENWSLDIDMWWNNTTANREMFVTGTSRIFVSGDNMGANLRQIWRKTTGPEILSPDFAASETEVCEETPILFMDLSTGDITSWEWTFEGGTPSSSTEQNPVVTYSEPGVYDVELTISDGNLTLSNLKEDYITIISTPSQASTPVGDAIVCNNDAALYTSTGADNADSYQWILSPSNAGSLYESGLEVTVLWNQQFSGEAFISLYGINDCGEGETSESLSVEVEGTPMPEINGVDLVCDDQTEEYSVDHTSGNSYLWEVNGGSIIEGQGTNMITITWGGPGNGSIMVTEESSNGCSGDSDEYAVMIDDCTGLFENNDSNGISLYPNPVSNMLNIKLDGIIGNDVQIKIFDILGKVIFKEKINNGTLGSAYSIDMGSYSKGLYFMQIQTNGASLSQQFIKQ